MPQLAKESIAPDQPSPASWMVESIGRWSVKVDAMIVGVTMHKASFKTLSMKQVCALIPDQHAVLCY